MIPYWGAFFNDSLWEVFVAGFLGSVVKLCVEWALSLNKRVGVSACQLRMPDTHVFVPTLHKSFLDDLLEFGKRLARVHMNHNMFYL